MDAVTQSGDNGKIKVLFYDRDPRTAGRRLSANKQRLEKANSNPLLGIQPIDRPENFGDEKGALEVIFNEQAPPFDVIMISRWADRSKEVADAALLATEFHGYDPRRIIYLHPKDTVPEHSRYGFTCLGLQCPDGYITEGDTKLILEKLAEIGNSH